MTDQRELSVADLKVGLEVSVFKLEDGCPTWGQGGTVVSLDPAVVLVAAGTEHTFPREEFGTGFTIYMDVPTDASECVEYGVDCSGEVEYFDPSGRGRGVQRCAHHRDRRSERYRNGIEAYAHSAAAPSWFDPTYAGESWDED